MRAIATSQGRYENADKLYFYRSGVKLFIETSLQECAGAATHKLKKFIKDSDCQSCIY